jgi:hypothetical protein
MENNNQTNPSHHTHSHLHYIHPSPPYLNSVNIMNAKTSYNLTYKEARHWNMKGGWTHKIVSRQYT